MLTLPHALFAVAIVRLIPNPVIALPLALASHFVLDFFVPHWNPHLYTEFSKDGKISKNSLNIIALDTILAFAFCLLILFRFWPNIYLIAFYGAAIFLAILPDIIEIPYYFFNSKAKWLTDYVDFEHRYQSNGGFLIGMTTQVIVVILSLLVFFN